jgi:hypothetical protein
MMRFFMERPRALPLRTRALFLGLSFGVGALASGCNPKIEELPKERSARDTLGQEIYKVLCRRVAGTELPNDIDGSDTEVLCLGDQETADEELEAKRAELPARLVALAERRKQIADALNRGFPDETASGIEDIMQSLLPFYDPPEEVLQEGTRRTAAMLLHLADNEPALEAMARFGREGMVPQEGDFGITRAALSHRRVADVLAKTLPALTSDALAPALSATLKGVALELASSELETDPSSDTCQTRGLFSRSESSSTGEPPRFGSGKPLYNVLRDVRGMPIPNRENDEGSVDQLSACGVGGQVRSLPYPFVDKDQDGFADVEDVNFSVDPSFEGPLPEPYEVVGEGDVARDAFGRALALKKGGGSDAREPLFLTRDADASLLAASLRVSARAFAPSSSLLENLIRSLPALLGDERKTERRYEKATYKYSATDPDQSPLVAALHASSVLTADPLTDEAAELSLLLLRDHEVASTKSLEPLLALERRTRPGMDAYPDAKLEPKNTFWNEMLWEAEKLSRRRLSKDGETLLEATMRASLGFGRNFGKPGAPMEQLIDAELLSRQGSILAMLMRYKDEWRGNPKPRDERPPGDSDVIGTLNTPVDRNAPPTPIKCGRDGCGGLVVGSPFERWRNPDAGNCLIPPPEKFQGRPVTARDCGAPANQSILHRSMGLLAELAGRKQCSRPITVRDLFDFAAADEPPTPQEEAELENTIREAELALAEDYTCPANQPTAPCRAYAQRFPSAFVPRTGESGPLPPAIQECGLLDLSDVGRIFGKVLTHEYQLEVPNPWVRRYLEDVARAADGSLPTCAPGVILDPTVVPPCVTNAAKLSRGVFEELPACNASDPNCIDTLSELIEFLLDDKALFQSETDERELRPDARTLTRVLFAPAGASAGFALFDPLLVANAPPVCAKVDARPRCSMDDTKTQDDARCCITSLEDAPLRFRLDTFYGSTTYAWEHMFKFKDGKELSFLDAGVSISDAFNRLDIPKGANPDEFEDKEYIFTNLGNLLALHYDSPENDSVQGKDPKLPGYRKLSGLVRYEELLADLADDGSLDLKQKGPHGGDMFAPALSFSADQQLGFLAKSLDLLLALDALSFRGGDGISALARSTESLLNPHAWCAGEGGDKRVLFGRGACDAASPVRAPIATRDGRDFLCYRDGTCFDGKTSGVAKRFASSATLLFDALQDLDDRRLADPDLAVTTRKLLGEVLDAFSALENGRLKDRRLRAMTLVAGEHARERWAAEKASGTLATLGKRSVDDMVDSLTNPAVAGGIELMRGLLEDEEAFAALKALVFALLDERSEPSAARAFLAFAADSLQSLPGDENANALSKTFAFAAAPNIDAVLAGKEPELDVLGSVAWNNIFTLGETAKADQDDVLNQFLGAMAGARSVTPDRPAPVTVLYDALIDINREKPLEHGQHTAADYREAFKRIADVMLDKRRGFERLYALVHCSRVPDDPTCD